MNLNLQPDAGGQPTEPRVEIELVGPQPQDHTGIAFDQGQGGNPPATVDPIEERLRRIETGYQEFNRAAEEQRRASMAANLERGMAARIGELEQAVEKAKAAMRTARSVGDENAEIEANAAHTKAVADLTAEQYRQEEIRSRVRSAASQPQAKDSTNLDAWRAQNKWYGTNPALTNLANQLHDQVVREGYVEGSQAYFRAIDQRMDQHAPGRNGNGGAPMAGSSYGTQAQAQSGGVVRMRLDEGQKRAMEKWGVTAEQWFKGRQAAVNKGLLPPQPTYGRIEQ